MIWRNHELDDMFVLFEPGMKTGDLHLNITKGFFVELCAQFVAKGPSFIPIVS